MEEKLNKIFQEFLEYDKKQDYYYHIIDIDINKNYYEIKLNYEENEVEDLTQGEKDDYLQEIVLSRFIDYYFDNIDNNADVEQLYYSTCEYVIVY